jgi:RNA polymerase sigma factor (sigma-70 family)
VFERLDTLREDEAVRPWIAQLTRRLCIDRLRSGGREIAADAEELPEAVAEDVLSQLEEAFDVHEALAGLPEHCREILDRFFARDESYRAIGQALELPAGTIASRISRCLEKLREVFVGRNEPGTASSEQVTR